MADLLKKHWALFSLFLVEIFLFSVNFQPGTYFLGWDNLFPEMNFSANFQRSFFSVWQEYRGLGLLDGMSFAANLPHYLFLFLLSFILPLNLLRYFFIFFMHFLGGVGMYFLILELTGENLKMKWAAFVGALFYMLNIGTVQMFFVPYEVFTVHFAFLPILTLFLIKYLKNKSLKYLSYFAIASFLSVPQAHVPTLFIVYLFVLSVIFIFHLFYTGKKGLAQVVTVIAVTFVVNSFWGLPYAYSVVSNVQAVSSSKINQMSTEEIYLRNRAFGDFADVALMKGFSLDFVANQASGRDFMMKPWRTYVQQPVFIIIAWLFFALMVFGLLNAIRRKEKLFLPFIVILLLSFLMLADDVPVIGGFSFLLRTYLPFFDQVFRFTFTKFFFLYALAFSVFISLGLISLSLYIQPLARRLSGNLLNLKTITIIFLLMLVLYSLPSWQGNFLYRAQGLKVPNEYFSLVDFLKKQNPNSRVALIPQTSFWGWTYTTWGYQGSGFIWYGIPQSSLDGAFYPWSRENENYYWELSQAFFQKDRRLFENVLEKYQISWVVVDNTLQSPFSLNLSYKDQIQAVIDSSDKVKLVKKFGNLGVYQVYLASAPQNFVFLEQNLPMVGPAYQWGNIDQGYLENGNYISAGDNLPDSFYPFRSLFTGREQKELTFTVEEKQDYLSFKSNIPPKMQGGTFIIPALGKDQRLGIPEVYIDGNLIQFDSLNTPAEIVLSNVNKGALEVRVPKLKELGAELNVAELNLKPRICNEFNQGILKLDKVAVAGKNLLKMTSIGSDNCLNLSFPYLLQQWGYLVTVESSHEEGKSLTFALINQVSQRADLEVNLPKEKESNSYFIVPPMDNEGLGYTLYFDNVSIGRIRTVNSLGKITVNPIPYQFLKSLRVMKGSSLPPHTQSVSINSYHPNPSLYIVDAPSLTGQNYTLVLSQSFNKGWKAYEVGQNSSRFAAIFPFIFGKEITNHVLVNNWENGWVITADGGGKSRRQVVIIYLPQYLEFFGMLLPFIYMGLLIFKRRLPSLPHY